MLKVHLHSLIQHLTKYLTMPQESQSKLKSQLHWWDKFITEKSARESKQ